MSWDFQCHMNFPAAVPLASQHGERVEAPELNALGDSFEGRYLSVLTLASWCSMFRRLFDNGYVFSRQNKLHKV